MKLFLEGGGLYEALIERRKKMNQDVVNQAADYLLNVNEVELVRHFVDKYRVEPLVIHEDQVMQVPREAVVQTYGSPIKRQIIRFHIPFSGDKDLLRFTPSTRIMWTEDLPVDNGEILLDCVNHNDNPRAIRNRLDSLLNNLKTQAGHSTSEIAKFNEGLEQAVIEAVKRRKADLLRQANLVAALGVPLKKASDVPSTFSVPAIKKKVIIAKPTAPTGTFVPEPTLPESTYHDIVKAIHDMGVEIERHPSIYEGKDEESLRDHFLMMLAPNFPSATGETFNKAGKTDILIRHEGKNLFVAECAIWKGIKGFLGKIDQLLSYLTWRDSKTALVCFVRNKEIDSVLEAINNEVPKHPRFLKSESSMAEGWLRYQFTLPDDQHRTVHTAVLCFHFP